MGRVIVRATGVWLLIVVVAVLNGLLRERLLVPAIGAELALPASGLSLAVLVFLVSLLFVPAICAAEPGKCILTGLYWVILTVSFEFVFGHFVAGKSWQQILQVFNPAKGDLFVVVLFVTAGSPYLAAKARGLF